jgi:hypothetical protein
LGSERSLGRYSWARAVRISGVDHMVFGGSIPVIKNMLPGLPSPK